MSNLHRGSEQYDDEDMDRRIADREIKYHFSSPSSKRSKFHPVCITQTICSTQQVRSELQRQTHEEEVQQHQIDPSGPLPDLQKSCTENRNPGVGSYEEVTATAVDQEVDEYQAEEVNEELFNVIPFDRITYWKQLLASAEAATAAASS